MNQFARLFLLFTFIASLNTVSADVCSSDSLAVHQEMQSIRVKLVASRLALERLSGKIQAVRVLQDSVGKDIELALERLGQSERALNTSLESFRENLDDQNQVIDEVKEMMSQKMERILRYQLLAMAAGLMLVIVISLLYVRRALKRQAAHWNSFQEQVFKS